VDCRPSKTLPTTSACNQWPTGCHSRSAILSCGVLAVIVHVRHAYGPSSNIAREQRMAVCSTRNHEGRGRRSIWSALRADTSRRSSATPAPHEVLIAIDTAGVGSSDASIRDGSWRRPGAATIPAGTGVDGAGIVVAKGARVRRVELGDRVYAYEFGNHVIATASGAAPACLVRKLGAHRVIDARRTKSIDQLRTYAPDGLDGALALAGGEELERCLDFVRPRGRVVHPNGVEPVPVGRPTFRLRAFDAVANPREFDKLNRHLANGRIRVPIAASYPLGRAAQAHRRLDRAHVLGRMVLQVRRKRP
jgi:NADPH:quinone reductase-like Zn-dependent oxidoreductase